VVGDFNTHLSSIHRSSRQKNQQILELNWQHRSNGPDGCLQNIPSYNSTMYILAEAPGTFLKTNHISDHKESLKKCKKLEITPCILS
jgi:hypothetical protein